MCELDFSTEPTEASGQFETALLGSLIPEMTRVTFIIVKGAEIICASRVRGHVGRTAEFLARP